LRAASTHFAPGKNWASFAGQTTRGSRTPAPVFRSCFVARNRSLLDIGSGSGSCRLGVFSILAIDIDPISAETTCQMMSRHAPQSLTRNDRIGFKPLQAFG